MPTQQSPEKKQCEIAAAKSIYKRDQFRCFIVGEGTLPIQCGEIVLDRGHEICGIISRDASILRWAEGKAVAHMEPTDDLILFMSRCSFDYLFSIVNSRILPKNLLELPGRYAINYHDALLPKYAGSHATSWAIMQRETTHGVTWHEMTDLIDAGNILQQCSVDIADDETAFTLNAKCYDAAIRSFAELVEDLSSDRASVRKQDPDKRSFFPRYKRPAAGCVLSWNGRAHDIDAFVRALDFGRYPNPLGLPKLAKGRAFFIVTKIAVLDSTSDTPPGTITAIERGSLKVSTADRDIALRMALTIDGQPLPISDLVARFELRQGDRFTDLDPEIARRITDCYASACKHEGFWVKRLDELQPMRLPYAGRNTSDVKPAQYATVRIPLAEEVVAFLEHRRADWSTEDFLLGVFAAYLSRIGGDRPFDIGFSDIELRRNLVGLEGFFASHLPLRVNADCTRSFAEFFHGLREQVKLVRQHETYARDVVARYPVLRSSARLPGAHTLSVIVDQTERPDGYEPATGSELTLLLPKNRAECRLVYDARVLEEDSVRRISGQLDRFLRDIATDSGRRIADFHLLSEAESHQLLVEFNDTDAEYPKERCVHELFEIQVEKTPDAIALVFEEQQLTYRELSNRANQLAHYLQKLGVGPEVLVGICLERSIEMIVGLLAILKAGGAYVPLDPTYPKERLAFMIGDSQAPVVLTQSKLLEQLPTRSIQNRTICLDTDWKTVAQESAENPTNGAKNENLAYVIYTSGSTGNPKGVMVEHRSLVNYLCWFSESPLAEKALNLPVTTRLTFDASLKQLFPPLLHGNQVFLVSDAAINQPANLLEAIRCRDRFSLNCVPSLWNAVTDAIDSDPDLVPPEALSSLLLGGENPSRQLLEKTFATYPGLDVWNLYGPTEATVNATVARLHPDSPIIIGRPIGNTQVYILDPHLNPVPIAVAGEIHIGGEGLARGYWNRPELTTEKFISNPFSDTPGSRLFKTGDIARYLPDGNIEFLGRIDDQVKLRGYRIELAEIETVLGQHPAIQHTVVLAREDSPGDKRLVAYIVATAGSNPSAQDLRRFLQQKLPEYMVPSAIMFLESLPLTPNGKLDRNALPAPDQCRPELDETFVAARTPVEKILASIWADVLKLDKVGIHDNFFELGGHSLLATQVLSRVNHSFQVKIQLRRLFETPTIATLAASIGASLGTEEDLQRIPPIVSTPRRSEVPLSFAQQRLWFLDQLEPGYSAYNIPVALRLTGPLDVTAFERSLSEILRRHDALRTTFPQVNGQPVQVILPFEPIKLTLLNLQEQDENEREALALRLAAEEARRSFDLVRGPLLRACLLRLDQDEHVLLITIHHIASDGWSMGILFRELSVIYEAFSRGQPSPLAELPIQYVDFAVWQREWLQGGALERDLAYWKQQLAGAPAMLELPTDRPRTPVQSFRGAREPVTLPKSLSELLNALSRREGVTLFMTLLAAFKVLLSRYIDRCDIVLGTPIAGRTDAKTEELIGFFANTLVLRTDLSGDPTFRVLLKRVREVSLEAYNHQELPFEKVVELVQPERDLSYNPLFQVLFALHNTPPTLLKLPGLVVDPLDVEYGTARFDLALDLREQPQGLIGSLEYNTDLFDAATITRMLGHFQTLLECVTADPDQRLSTLSILTETEWQQVLDAWNGKAIQQKRDKCLHELFESQVERAPDAVAVVCEGKRLTYRELNRRANQLANHLRKLGVQPEVPVGICVERSVHMVVGLLAILKAGGAYVPLDPNYPTERLAYVLDDIQAPVVITQQHLKERLPEAHAAVISLDADWKMIAEESQENLAVQMTSENLAYVIYTSGSTGRPKGVQILHRSVARLLEATRPLFGFDEHDVWTVFHSYAFDFSVWEIWGALLQGGRLVVVPLQVAQSPAAFRDLLHRERVTVLNQTPSAMRQLIGELPETLKSAGELDIRLIICGGEAFPMDLASKSLEFGVPVWNFYGPTEATVWAAINPITSTGSEGNLIPIGRPMADRQIYLLDRNLQAVPVGVAGEIHIGGAGLARGYLMRPELTAEKFIPDPFSNEPGARLYKTGDSARYLRDGAIDFLGRIDNQVKLRGYRIELGEIEATLGQHPSIEESIVLAREDSPGDKRLVAYTVAAAGSNPSAQNLRSFLQHKLPDFMVPSAFVFLDSLPLTPNGKLDRNALPAPDHSRPELEDAFAAPRTPVEENLANIWAVVLKLDKIGIHDNFFGLGGHSLLATQVVSRIRDAFKLDLPLRSLFESSTVAGLAERIEKIRHKEQGPQIPPLLAVSRDKDLPLSFAQQRLWFLDQLDPGKSLYTIPSAIRLRGELNVRALEQSLQEIVDRHEALRTSFPTVGDKAVQVIAPSLPLKLPIVDLSARAEPEQEALEFVGEESRRAFDLSRGPLFRAPLLRLSRQDHILLLTLHHSVSDGWSMAVLYRELSALYEAFSNGKPSPLVPLPIQYADFAVWQRQWLQGELLEHQLSYWREQLAELEVLQLPTDRPRPAVQSYRGEKQSTELSEALTQGLKVLSGSHGVTLYMTLLAAFQALLRRHTGQVDIAVGSPIANRNHHATESLIGFFVNTLVIRTDLSGSPTFRELLGRVREVALEAYAHQDLPFEKLVEELQPERDLSRTPFFQVFFNMLGPGDGEFSLKGLSAERIATGDADSKFDLTTYVSEQDEKLKLTLAYNADLFESDTISNLLGHYCNLLEGIVENPDRQISRYSLLTQNQRRDFTNQSQPIAPNHRFVQFRKQDIEQSLCSRFEQQARLFPTKLALTTQEHQWSYAELNRQANRIAHTLLKHCGQGGERIALLFDHGAPMVAAILGVLKSNNAYVPLDRFHPQERLAYISGNCRTAVFVSDRNNLAQALALGNRTVPVIDVDDIDGATPIDNPALAVSPNALAYILYTSGSTGQPKGVMQNHRNVLHHIRCYTNNLHIGCDDKLTLLSTYGFDAAVQDIFGALLNGATLCPLDVKTLAPAALVEQIVKQTATIYHSTPTVYRYLFSGLSGQEDLSAIRMIVLGGEEVQKTDVDLFKKHGSQECILVNGLGPTESTLTLQHFITHKTQLSAHRVPVGYPVEDTEVVLLDETGMATEVYGEIGIRSEHVALGYWDRPKLTAASFLTDPQGGTRRLYRTGDMGRLLPDGSIGFCGRKDFQVKIRGYRIELGEIEAVLAQHPSVTVSVVLASEDSPDDRRLVAYIVAAAGSVPSAHELRSFLHRKLPEFMVPSAYVFLNSLPLTPNGKLDRKALPAPDHNRAELENSFAAPRTSVEEILADIWAEVLKHDKVGIHDNFFHLGGHSLLATQIVSRIHGAFGIELPLRCMFESPTVADLAMRITEQQAQGASKLELTQLLRELEAMTDNEAQKVYETSRRN